VCYGGEVGAGRWWVLGQHKRDISAGPYQSGWKELYEQEAECLRRALGNKALRIEHIGSTSVPGMVSKPILDIMVAVVSLTRATELIPAIEALGYQHKPHDTIPERVFFAKEHPPENRTHHLNLAELGSGFWKDQLAFRDYLRAHDQIAAEYADLKKRLAAAYARTGELDRDGKSEFVGRVLALAAQEVNDSS
jgi:GrpB-like predicted nucleotidyltransferase (UPF0157 family)